jgi:hypothetical protein
MIINSTSLSQIAVSEYGQSFCSLCYYIDEGWRLNQFVDYVANRIRHLFNTIIAILSYTFIKKIKKGSRYDLSKYKK